MTPIQERAITLSLNMLQVGFFECPKHYYEYFVSNDEWATLLTAAGLKDVNTPPLQLALAALQQAVARKGLFADMSDFQGPPHYCSFLAEKVRTGERSLKLEPCQLGQKGCPYATFEHLQASKHGTCECLPKAAGPDPGTRVPILSNGKPLHDVSRRPAIP